MERNEEWSEAKRIRFFVFLAVLSKTKKQRQRVVGGYRQDGLWFAEGVCLWQKAGFGRSSGSSFNILRDLRVLGVENWRPDAICGEIFPGF